MTDTINEIGVAKGRILARYFHCASGRTDSYCIQTGSVETFHDLPKGLIIQLCQDRRILLVYQEVKFVSDPMRKAIIVPCGP